MLLAPFLSAFALAIPAIQTAAQADELGISNDTCLACHGEPSLGIVLASGEPLSLYIDPELFAASVHGRGGYACVQCHTGLSDYPHPTLRIEDRRHLALQLYQACKFCHSGEYDRTLDSAHEQARSRGILEAAICTDCHGAHDTRRLTDPASSALLPESRTWIPTTCARCHSAIYEKYLTSVHGVALVDEGNTDVPTCIDCHGVHDIEDPRTASFRLKSPELCAGCHTDPVLMAQYGLSTDVLRTYVADFHGTTVTLFEKLSPDAETNKPVCYDCHGVHDIKRIDDPLKGLQVRSNLLQRCQVCHPDATANFPDAWLSHYIPTAERHALVFAVDTFYKFFIPTVLGGMGVLVALDLSWRVRNKLRRRRARRAATPEASASSAESPANQMAAAPSQNPAQGLSEGSEPFQSTSSADSLQGGASQNE